MNGDQFFERMQSDGGGAPPKFVFMSGALLDPDTMARFTEKGDRRRAISHGGAGGAVD